MTRTDSAPAGYYFPIPVRYADTDAQTHVFFGNYFTYLDEAYMGYLEAIGFSWATLSEMGLETYYVSAECQFLGRAYYGDVLNVYTECSKLGNTSLVVEMTVVKSGADATIASGRMTAVMIDIASETPVPIPDSFRDAVDRFRAPTLD